MLMNVKPNLKRGLLLILTILFFTTSSFAPNGYRTEEQKNKILDKYMEIIEFEHYYEFVVNSIKKREGFVNKPYYCPGGVLTIGYGHAIKKNEKFNDFITEKQADSLLRKDLDECIKYLESSTNLKHVQLLAISHFVYNVGSGNFEKSTLKQLITAEKPIDKEIIKWIHIKTKKGIKKSDWLLQSRKIELELFNLKT